MAEEKNKVSVVCTCYKLESYLLQALSSIANQTYQNFEIIVVDDGGYTSYPVYMKFLQEYPSMSCKSIFVQQWNRKPSSALNVAIKLSTGNLLTKLDADDYNDSNFIEECIKIYEATKADIVTMGLRIAGTNIIGIPGGKFDYESIMKVNQVYGAAMFTRKSWELVGGFDENMIDGYEDWEFWIRLIKSGCTGYCIQKPLYTQNVRQNSRNNTALKGYDLALKDYIWLKHKGVPYPR